MVFLLYLQSLQQLDAAVAGPTDFNNANNIGATFTFYVDTTATDVQIVTDGTDKFTGCSYGSCR